MTETKFQQRLTELGFNSYEQYLESDHWRQFRERYKWQSHTWLIGTPGK